MSTFDDTESFWVENPDETEFEQGLRDLGFPGIADGIRRARHRHCPTYTAREVARVRAESPLFRTDAELAATSEEWMT